MVSDRNGYYDSQNIVAVGGKDGRPLVLSVVLHHCESHEGGAGLRLYATRSLDEGRSWTPLVPIEESLTRASHDGYQLVHSRPDGGERIYVFYGYNDGILSYVDRKRGSRSPVELPRSDMQLREGYFFRFSDDAAETWSRERYVIPVRRTRIDRENPWGGEIMGMFMCDKPHVVGESVYFAFQKTRDGGGETPGSEVFFLRSRNLLSEADPRKATWETLPDGDVGLQAPGGASKLGEEPHVLAVNPARPERLFSLWRSDAGRIAASYSSDGGVSWDPPFWLTYEGVPVAQGGVQEMRNPRGSLTPYRLQRRREGAASEFLLLFYNNAQGHRTGYCAREVYWISAGREAEDGTIWWGQPEIALWWDGPALANREGWNPDWGIVDGPGYPDWLEREDGSVWFVESNKLAVRYHRVEPWLLDLLRAQPEVARLPASGKVVDEDPAVAGSRPARAPVLPDLRTGAGFTLIAKVRGSAAFVRPAQKIVAATSTVTAARDQEPTEEKITKGYEISVTASGEIELFVTDGFGATFRHATTVGGWSALWDGRAHVVSFVVDGGPRVVSVVVDERLNDGADQADQGWCFHAPDMGEIGGADLRFPAEFEGVLERFLVYDRALLTTEAIAAYRSLCLAG